MFELDSINKQSSDSHLKMPRVIVIDDDKDSVETLSALLQQKGVDVVGMGFAERHACAWLENAIQLFHGIYTNKSRTSSIPSYRVHAFFLDVISVCCGVMCLSMPWSSIISPLSLSSHGCDAA